MEAPSSQLIPGINLCDLPDLALVHILNFIELQELLLNVSKVNKRFHYLINETSSLWKNFEFDFPLEFEYKHLENVVKHSKGIQRFHIPYATVHASSYELDFLFSTQLSRANVYSLDLTGCRLSTLCFLQCFRNLQILNISECKNIISEDLEAVLPLTQLERLYISFTNIEPDTIVRVCSRLSNLILLDVSGIKLTVVHCANILTDKLRYFSLSLESDEDEIWFCGIARRFANLSVHIYRPFYNY